MFKLVKVGKSSWVNPEAVIGVDWNGYYDCPKIVLSTGAYISARAFREDNYGGSLEVATDALVAFLSDCVDKPKPAPDRDEWIY